MRSMSQVWIFLRGGSVQLLKQILSSVARVMKRDLHTLPVSGTVQDVEMLLSSTAVNGFPIVTDDARQTLVGYIGRREVRYVIGMFLKTLVPR
jgi:predicted transcriptional regulator